MGTAKTASGATPCAQHVIERSARAATSREPMAQAVLLRAGRVEVPAPVDPDEAGKGVRGLN
jgi:hypothetical protein